MAPDQYENAPEAQTPDANRATGEKLSSQLQQRRPLNGESSYLL